VVRLALAAMLALQPVVQAAELAPVNILLTRVVPQDQSALATAGPEKGERLAKLQSDLALVVEGIEGFASEDDAKPSLKRLRESIDASEQFKDRAAALDAAYRALAVVDYTWAKRLPDAPCSPEASRSALLKSGALSSWLSSLLGVGSDAAASLDRASAATTATAREYALLRAKALKMSEALGSEKAVGGVRASLYCRRAGVYEALSAANRSSGLVAASRATAVEDALGVYVLARQSADGLEVLGAATAIDGVIVTDARLVDSEGLVLLRRDAKKPIPVRVERRDSGLALLKAAQPLKGLVLAENAPAKSDLIEAIGHLERTGAWTRTRGLVTSVDGDSFQSDAVVDVGMTGGAALTEDGKLAGVFVLRRAQAGDEAFDWPVAVSAPALKRWLAGEPLSAPAGAIEIAEAGTASILTASRSLLDSLKPGSHATEASSEFTHQGIRWVCKANCDDAAPVQRARPRTKSYSSPRSSSGSNANAELGKAIGEALAPLVEELVFKGIPALFRGIGSLFKSKPKSARSPRAAQETVVNEPPPKPNPELIVTLTPTSIIEGKQAHFLVTVKSNRDDVKTSGLSVTFTVEHDKEKKTGTAVTDASGTAVLEVTPDPAARSFVDLQKENERHPTLINTGRETTAERICKIILPGSMILGGLTAAAVLVPTPQGMVLTYAGGAQCLSAATGLIAGAGIFCTVEFGRQVVAPNPRTIVPSYSASELSAAKKPESVKEKAISRAEVSHESLDDEARKHSEDASAPTDEGSVVGSPPVDPNEPPNNEEEDNENKSDGISKREELLSKVEDKELRDVVDRMYRKNARIGDGSSMDAYRYETRTGIKLSDSGHASKLIERRSHLLRILRNPGLKASDAKITKNMLINIQSALSGL